MQVTFCCLNPDPCLTSISLSLSAFGQCIGLFPGSTAVKVAEHVQLTWERGKRIIDLVREELGVDADALVPLINGGVTLTKLCGSMHDTCNSANLIAKKVNPYPLPFPYLSCVTLPDVALPCRRRVSFLGLRARRKDTRQ